ncbi:MAG: aldolase/citrate lyase family protein [Dongiaceae bacterium]
MSQRPRRSGKSSASGTTKLAFWLQRAHPTTCEIAALVGYDIVLIDMEHGAIGVEAADALVVGAKQAGLTVYVRVSHSERVPIQYALDSGADGVILPQLQDADHARVATAYAKYPPLGTRGVGFSRTHDYAGTPRNFTTRENRRARCFAMIETPGALADAEAIAVLPTVDGLFVGPADLSMTRGRGLVQGNAADQRDWRQAAQAALAVGKSWAIPAHDPVSLRFARRHQAEFVTISDDLSAIRQGFLDALAMAGRS